MDPHLTSLLEAEQYSVAARQKETALLTGLNALTRHHQARCTEYSRILRAQGEHPGEADRIADVPYLPVSLFKSVDLRSIDEDSVFKVLTSSGTTSQVPSRIYVDVETARLQTRALSSIVTHYLGRTRRPMLIVDHPGVIRDRRSFSARGAGILGMLSYGRDHLYLLDDEMHLDRAVLSAWLDKHRDEDLFIFGFTFMVWQDLLQPLRDADIDLSRAVLVHSGGWKKLQDVAVTSEIFRRELREAFGLVHVHDFYGMIEQIGSVFFACPSGYFHAPNFADVIARDPRTWLPAPDGRPGLLEVVSLIPLSYPGHAVLTEDIGIVHGTDDCPCGRLGRRFEVVGRVPKAEVRGCSDTVVRVS